MKIQNLELVILQEYQFIKKILQKAMLQIVLLLYYAPNTIPRTYVISDLTGEEIVGTFYKKELQKQIKKSLESKNL